MMEVSDKNLCENLDWDPAYLSSIFDCDFHDISYLWNIEMNDMELMEVVRDVERYSPIVEDISIEDSELCRAVEQIEEE